MGSRHLLKGTPAAGRELDDLAAANAGGRLVKPEEVAEMVAALCGPAANSMTGEVIEITGAEDG